MRGFTGFGMAIILVPLLSLTIPPGDAVVLAILLQLLIGPVGIRSILADADRSSAVTIAVAAMLATPVGLLLLAATPADYARTAIAFIAIGAFLLVVLPQRAAARPSRASGVMTGLAAGLLTGFAAMPGPPVVPFYMRQRIAPRTARASMMLIFFATAIAGTIAAAARGLAPPPLLLLSAALFVPMVAGNWLGGRFFGRIPAPVWRTGVGVVLGVAAASALFRLLN